MNTRLQPAILSLLFAALSLLSCGKGGTSIVLSGSVDVADILHDIHGTTFLSVTTTDDVQKIMRDPLNTIAIIAAVDPSSYEFRMDLSDTFLDPGDEVFIISFVDNDYSNGIPYPTVGDFVGFYVNRTTLSTRYKLKKGDNPVTVKINRRVYDFDATVSGTIGGTDRGDVLLIAYAGEISSLDLGALDVDSVIGYQRFKKGASPLPYTMNILPYGKDVPIGGVYLFAVLDRNGSGAPDGGDRIGYYSGNERGIPTAFTVAEGDTPGMDISFAMDLSDPSTVPVSITGSFEKPAGYDGSTHPAYVIVAKADDPSLIFTSPMQTVKYFMKMPAGENTFSVDLSSSGCLPGDSVIVLALWDLDSTGGFPDPTQGDLAGYVVNPDTFSYTVTLAEGENTVPGSGGVFVINKRIYAHDSSIAFHLEQGTVGDGDFSPDDRVMVVAVHQDGVNLLTKAIDIDYVVGMTTVNADFMQTYSMPVLPAILEIITVTEPFGIENIYIISMLDNDPANGAPDPGEATGYYWDRTWIFVWVYTPRLWDLTDGVNTLDRTVRFSSTF